MSDMTAKDRLISELRLLRQEFPTVSRHLHNLLDAALAEVRKEQMEADCEVIQKALGCLRVSKGLQSAIRRAFAADQEKGKTDNGSNDNQ